MNEGRFRHLESARPERAEEPKAQEAEPAVASQRIAAVTRDQVRTAFQRALQPQAMATIVVGGPEKAAAN